MRSPWFLPFMAVSMWGLAVGFGLEMMRLGLDPKLRKKLGGGIDVETGFGVLTRRPPDGDAPRS